MKSTTSFSIDEINEFFGEDLPILIEVYSPFKEEYPGLLENVYEGLREKNNEVIERGLHTLKGVFRNFFAHSLTDKLQDLETLASSGNIETIENELKGCDELAQIFFIDFDQYLKDNT